MNQTVNKISKIAAQIFGICSSGYVISILLIYIFSPIQRVPNGRWSMLYLGEKLSIQLNTQTFKKNGEVVSVWLREDRLQSFTAARGVVGTTVFTKVSIDCESNTVKFHEQLSFDNSLRFRQANKTVSEFEKPEDLLGLISTIIICQTPISDDSVVVTPINRLTV